jgi:N utilization substance protein A
MSKALIAGINQVATEKGLDREVIFTAIEAALVSAYKRNYGSVANVTAEVDRISGDMRVFAEREVVEEVLNGRTEISLEDGRAIQTEAQLGDVVRVETSPDDFGRIAAQTAKQVILQRIREAERDTVYENFAHKVGEILTAQVRSVDTSSGAVTLLLNEKHEILMMKEDQIPSEKLRRGDYLKVFVVDVHKSSRGPVIKLSRTHRNLLRRLMEREIPEVRDGLVEIKAIAREPGARSKAAVIATVPNVDPVGSCVGQCGLRIQNIVNELAGEKIDVIEWNGETSQYISNALSPARVTSVLLDEKSTIKTAVVIVPDKQLSLAIGKEGQNARLAAKLTGWRIDIKSETEASIEGLDRLVAERAALRLGRQEDLLSVAERFLKGEEAAGQDRLWQAAQALQNAGPAAPEIAEQMLGQEEEPRGKKPRPKATPEEVEGVLTGVLPEEIPDLTAAVAVVTVSTSGDFDDAFQRGLEALASSEEPVLPSEAPFSDADALGAGAEPLPQVITADMLRARMAQRKEAGRKALDIEVPAELLAGLAPVVEPDVEDELAIAKGKAKKGAPVKAAPKGKKKKWYPADGVDEPEF